MGDLLPFLIVGITSGSLYGLAGVGLVLTYRTSGVLNLAHGAIAAAGAYCFHTLHVEQSLPWPLAATATLGIFAVIGAWLLDPLTRRLSTSDEVAAIVVTAGLLLAVQGSLFEVYGLPRFAPQFLPQSGFELAGVTTTWAQVIAIAIALTGTGGLYALLGSTRTGRQMRAVVDDPDLLRLTGFRPDAATRLAWAIGAAFAAMSGILLAPTVGLDAGLLTLLVVQSFGACAVGRFTSLPGTYLGGIVVGIAAALATRYLTTPPWSGLPSAVPFVVLLGVLVLAPAGFPRRTTKRHVATPRRGDLRVGAAALAAGCVVVGLLSGTYLPVWIGAAITAATFSSLALLVGTSGQLSLCQLSFAAVGATTLAHLRDAGAPWLLALAGAAAVAAPIGAIVAVPAIRISGIYLALATLGFAILMQNVVFQSSWMFGAATTVSTSRPVLGPIDGRADRWYFLIVLCVTGATFLGAALIRRSQLGLFLRAVAEAPEALPTLGLRVATTKVLVFAASAAFAAVAGGLALTQFGSVSGQAFGPMPSLLLIAVLTVAGRRPILGPVLAAGLFGVVPGYLDGFDTNLQLIAFGIAAIVGGLLVANAEDLRRWLRRSAQSSAGRVTNGPVRARQPRPAIGQQL